MSEAVTVSGGTPTLTLNDGGTATYDAAHSTATSLVFDYTVAAGQNTASLAVTGVSLNGATVADAAGNAAAFAGADVTFSGLKIDTTAPTVTAATTSPATGTEGAGKTIPVTLAMSEAVTVSGGTPTLTLNDGGTATYDAAHSTATSLVFDYTVAAGQNTASLAVTGVSLNGATVADAAGNAAALAGADVTFSGLKIDTTAPTVTAASSAPTSGTEGAGVTIPITLAMSEAVTVSGGTPTLTLNDGGTATYDAAHSTATSLVFDYTVAAGQNTASLAVTGVSLNGATVADAAGNAAAFAGADVTFSGLKIDTTAPSVPAVAAPIVVHDTLQTTTGGTDSNLDDGALTITAVDGSSGNVGQPVAGEYGTLTLAANGNFTYTETAPNAVSFGVAEDVFTFNVSNAQGGTAELTFTVLNTNPDETYISGVAGSSISASPGYAVLDGSAGDMHVSASAYGATSQWLIGGPGDTLTGGKGADTFVFTPNIGKETINHFNTSLDVIDIPVSLVPDFAALRADIHPSGGGAVITLDATDLITLSHVEAHNLQAHNFHFVI